MVPQDPHLCGLYLHVLSCKICFVITQVENTVNNSVCGMFSGSVSYDFRSFRFFEVPESKTGFWFWKYAPSA